ncbi:hypothetical protein SDC9_180898 [bioreactor metagenome]|uniref:Uncharacterized protein n=1 Tax=bioreactor metagenome TaxID=1076179 RepID=A0A645H2Z1_9ZZZZ
MTVDTSAPTNAAPQYWVIILPASSKGMPNLFFTNNGAQVRKVYSASIPKNRPIPPLIIPGFHSDFTASVRSSADAVSQAVKRVSATTPNVSKATMPTLR